MRSIGVVTEQSYYQGNDIVVTIDYAHEGFSRVFFVSSEGVSRHIDMDNLERCLAGELQFDRDAFFFRGERAVQEAHTILNCNGLKGNFTKYIHEKINVWSPRKRAESERKERNRIRTRDIIEETLSYGIGGFLGGNHDPFVRDTPKIGRNEPCPCGSGKKYKKCCERENHEKRR